MESVFLQFEESWREEPVADSFIPLFWWVTFENLLYTKSQTATQLSFVKASPQHLTRSTVKRTEIIHTQDSTLWLDFSPFLCCENESTDILNMYCIVVPPSVPGKKLSRLHFISHIIVPSTNTIICGCYLWLVTCAAYPNAASGVYIIQEKKKKSSKATWVHCHIRTLR